MFCFDLLCTEDPVAGITEAGKDVCVVVEFAVYTADIDLDVGMCFRELVDALGCCDDAHELDVRSAVLLDGIDRINSASARSEHRIYNNDESLIDGIRELAIIIMRLMSNGVSVKTDMAYLRERRESLDTGNHTEACS